jgi:hypothetical protein
VKRNTALHLAAWIGTMVLANATPLGDKIQFTAAKAILAHSPNAPDVAVFAWWICFAILTGFCILAGKIMVALWGEAPKRTPHPGNSAVIDQYYNRKD